MDDEAKEVVGIVGIGTDNLSVGERNILRLENDKREMVVNITGDGRTVFGLGYRSPEAAAKLFWECIGAEYGSMRKSLEDLVVYVESHKVLKNADPVRALVEAKKILGR